MIIKEGDIKGPLEIQLEAKEDHRGYYMVAYNDDVAQKNGFHRNWIQENQSFSKTKGVLRGMHFQLPPFAQTKLFRVVSGEMYYAYVDLRQNSPTFGKWQSTILSAENKKMLYLPQGFAVGLCAMTDNCTMTYRVDNPYASELEYQIKWNDPDFNISWPIDGQPIISEKDTNAKSLKEFIAKHGAVKI